TPPAPHYDLPPLPLHDALPISPTRSQSLVNGTVACVIRRARGEEQRVRGHLQGRSTVHVGQQDTGCRTGRHELENQSSAPGRSRSEEHTSELQSRSDLVCRLLL